MAWTEPWSMRKEAAGCPEAAWTAVCSVSSLARKVERGMNSVLATLLRDGKHLTAALLCLNRARRRLTLVCGGHPPPVLVGVDGTVRLLAADGDILGVFDTAQFGVLEQAVAPGDRIYLYTDGVVERFGAGQVKSRTQGIRDLVEDCRRVAGLPLAAAVAAMTETAKKLAAIRREQEPKIQEALDKDVASIKAVLEPGQVKKFESMARSASRPKMMPTVGMRMTVRMAEKRWLAL